MDLSLPAATSGQVPPLDRDGLKFHAAGHG
jgi:hypothetical protein